MIWTLEIWTVQLEYSSFFCHSACVTPQIEDIPSVGFL